MREHGLLRRILLIYREAIRRLDDKQDFAPEMLAKSASLVRSFIEDYHEKLEEEYLFPRFKKANKLVNLVDILYQQHQQGRALTESALQISTASSRKGTEPKLRETLHLFIRMYEPHAAREDTVLFPALRRIMSSSEYDKLGDQFEEREHKLFGQQGFERKEDEVSGLEKAFGIYALARFPPQISK
jgi:hemerythrin-like domain-containing protein